MSDKPLVPNSDGDCSVTRPCTFVDYILKSRAINLPDMPETCIISHSQGILDLACSRLPFQTIDLGARRPVVIHLFGATEKPDFAMVASPLGAPMAAVLLEELIALGFHHFIAIGTAGHPAGTSGPSLFPGDLLLAESALVYEGTTGHYAPGTSVSYPDRALQERLARSLTRCGLDFCAGDVATTDAFYRETEDFLDEILSRGAVGIDMELSAMFTVSAFRRRKTAAVLYISDIVQSGVSTWDLAFVEKQVNEVEDRLFDALLDFMEGI